MSRPDAERRVLSEGAVAMGIDVEPAQLDRLQTFLDLVYRWNDSAGLTAIERADAARLHVLDSLSALPLLADVAELADLGTGGGFPGIPLAILRADLRVVLVEQRRRKCSFLREALRELGLGDCEVHEGDARALGQPDGTFETTIARAFLPPTALLPVLTGAARRRAVALLGPGAGGLPHRVPPGWERDDATQVVLPGSGERRLLLALRRCGG